MKSSYDLLYALNALDYLKTSRDPLWWPNSGTFEVVAGVLLTQQSKWERVEASLANLKAHDLLSLEALSSASIEAIAELIQPSGFYNMKAQRLQLLCANILESFGSFDRFQHEVDRAWLLAQKGIGMESADAILCYGCRREVFVVDSYTQRLLSALEVKASEYMQIQEWMQEGIKSNIAKVNNLYLCDTELSVIYARFHGKIVEYAKEHIRGKQVNVEPLAEMMKEKR